MKVVSIILIVLLIGGLGFLCVYQLIGLIKDIKKRIKKKKDKNLSNKEEK